MPSGETGKCRLRLVQGHWRSTLERALVKSKAVERGRSCSGNFQRWQLGPCLRCNLDRIQGNATSKIQHQNFSSESPIPQEKKAENVHGFDHPSGCERNRTTPPIKRQMGTGWSADTRRSRSGTTTAMRKNVAGTRSPAKKQRVGSRARHNSPKKREGESVYNQSTKEMSRTLSRESVLVQLFNEAGQEIR